MVLVAHGHVLRVLNARRLGMAPSAGALFRLDTATVSRIGTEHGRPVITAWNIVPQPVRPQAASAQEEISEAV